eukprot:gnl/MRDRNA2_/MRDRNA2_60938_c0_seq1.p1 gnl/MRDRNA2_/MRDRNA2_60938_c0~~gnl/MRDRNA2_/MRDRNA2_60938_c0_seq1.p1  ORF type:complete len:987 (-),score=226.58 gnl/MRDRNA2_/MRDRNA2_60938_c0_seq1:33-2993(-)
MEVVPFPLFERQARLLKTLAHAVKAGSSGDLDAVAEEADALASTCGVATCDLVDKAARKAVEEVSCRNLHDIGAVSVNPYQASHGGLYLRIEDFRHDMDSLHLRLTGAQGQLDQLQHSLEEQVVTSRSLRGASQLLRGDAHASHEALRSHDADLKEAFTRIKALEDMLNATHSTMKVDKAAQLAQAAEDANAMRSYVDKVRDECIQMSEKVQDKLVEAQAKMNADLENLRIEIVSGALAAAEGRMTKRLQESDSIRDSVCQQLQAQSGEMQYALDSEGERLRKKITAIEHFVDEKMMDCMHRIGEEKRKMEAMMGSTSKEAEQRAQLLSNDLAEVQRAIADLGDSSKSTQEHLDRFESYARKEMSTQQAELRKAHAEQDQKHERRTREMHEESCKWAKEHVQSRELHLLGINEETRSLAKTGAEEAFQRMSNSLNEAAADIRHHLAVLDGQQSSHEATQREVEASLRKALEDGLQNEHQHSESIRSKLLTQLSGTVEAVDNQFAMATSRLEEFSTTASSSLERMRLALDERVTNVQVLASTTKRELTEGFMKMEGGVADARKDLTSQVQQVCQDVNGLRSTFIDSTSTIELHLREECGKVEEMLNCGVRELSDAIQETQLKSAADLNKLRQDMHDRVAESDNRWAIQADAERAQFDEVGGHLVAIDGRISSTQKELQESVSVIKNAAGIASANAQKAKESAATAEVNIQRALHDIRDTEIRGVRESLHRVEMASGSLACGVLKMAQVCGFLPGLDGSSSGGKANTTGVVDSSGVMPRWDHIDLQDILDWERAGTPLADRIEKAWKPSSTTSTHLTTLLEMVQKKAESSMLKQLHTAVHELDSRVSAELHKNDIKDRDFATAPASGETRHQRSESRMLGFGQKVDAKSITTSERQNDVGGWWKGRSAGFATLNPLRQFKEGSLPPAAGAYDLVSDATTAVPSRQGADGDAANSSRGQTPLARRFGRKSQNSDRDAVFSSLEDPAKRF